MAKKQNSDEIYANVYITKDYERFAFLEDNRAVKQNRVNKIKGSIQEVGYILQPILVNEKYQIIDGQGRFNACMEMELPVLYVMQKGIGVGECRKLNMNQENWKPWDWICSYADGGNVDYQRFRTFVNNTEGLPISVITPLAFGRYRDERWIDEAVRKGQMKFSKEDAKRLRWEIDYILQLKDTMKMLTGRKRGFCGALAFAYRHLDIGQRNNLITVIKRNTSIMKMHPAIKDNLEMFDKFYNKNRKKDKINLQAEWLIEKIT